MSETTSPASLGLERARDALAAADRRHRKMHDRWDRAQVEESDAFHAEVESFAALQVAEETVEEILARLRLER